jgi:hypothetical protein
MEINDISKRFVWNPFDALVGAKLIELEGTPEAIRYFVKVCDDLTNYAYWFYLSTLWVSYSGHSDLELWRRLFAAKRPYKQECIMKPSEQRAFNQLPNNVTAFRAHRPGETGWIAYTLSPIIAARFARERGTDTVAEYLIKRKDILGLFTRRDEQEILVLDKTKAWFVREYHVVETYPKGGGKD